MRHQAITWNYVDQVLWYHMASLHLSELTHWGRLTYICSTKLTIIGSDNGLSPGRPQAIIWTNAGILLIGLLGTNFSEMLIKMYTFSFEKMHLKMSSEKWRPFCLRLDVLNSSWSRSNWDWTTTKNYLTLYRWHKKTKQQVCFLPGLNYFTTRIIPETT